METIENHLAELKSFYYVSIYKSFTQASDQLPISKAQVSKDVSRLETVLGVQLLQRTTRQVSLTHEGEQLFIRAQEIFKLTRAASEFMSELSLDNIGEISFTAPGSLGNWFVPHVVKYSQESFPNIKLSFDLNNVERNLIQDKIDFALRAMDVTDPNVIARYLGHLRDVIVVSKSFYKKHKKLLGGDIQNLKSLNCLLNSHQPKWNTWNFQKRNKSFEVKVEGNYSISSYNTIKILCLKSFGVARLPFIDVEEEIRSGELIEVFSDYKIQTHPLYLVYPVASYRTKMKDHFKDSLISWFKSQKKYLL